MKKNILYVITLILIFNSLFFVLNLSNCINVNGSERAKIVFDETNFPFYTINSSNPHEFDDNRLTDLEDLLVANSYSIDTIDFGNPVDISTLNQYDVLVSACSNNSYTISEILEIEDWIKNGGSMLMIKDGFSNGYGISGLAERFDYTFGYLGITDNDDYLIPPHLEYWFVLADNNIKSHTINTNVSRIECYFCDGIKTEPVDAIPLLVTDNDDTTKWWFGEFANDVTLASAVDGGTAGNGRIVVFTDISTFINSDSDSDGYINLYDSSHEIFVLNIFNWLARYTSTSKFSLSNVLIITALSFGVLIYVIKRKTK